MEYVKYIEIKKFFIARRIRAGVYRENATEAETQEIRNKIKQKIDSLQVGEYLISEIIKSDSYYDDVNKEFCFKRDSSSSNTDMLTKIMIIGYDDEYNFIGNLASSKGAYKVKKLNSTEEFYVSYEDTWVEAELTTAHDANGIVLDKTSLELDVGETIEVYYTVLPEDALSKGIKVSYSDGIEIDTTTSGAIKVKGIQKGDAYIIVNLQSDKEITAKCDIKVRNNAQETPNPNPTPIIPTPIEPTPDLTSPTPITPSPIPVTPTPIEEKIESNKYLIDVNKKYISKVIPGAKIGEFKNNITLNINYELYNKNENLITDDNGLIATGMKLKTQNQAYTIIVKGDIDGNGKLSITDLVKARLFISHIKTPNEIEELSTDINGDGKLTVTDLVKLKLATANIKPIE